MVPKINIDTIKEYLATGGKFVGRLALKYYGESLNQAGESAFSEAIEIGIANSIAALYAANVGDKEIIRVMNECWGITAQETEDRLIYEKSQATIRALRQYLKLQGFSTLEIGEFMKLNRVSFKIRHEKELWKLRNDPKKLMKAVQENK